MPHDAWRVHRPVDILRELPLAQVPGDHEPEPHGRGIPDDMPDLPHADAVDQRNVQPPGDVPADQRARRAAVQQVPYDTKRVHGPHADMPELPPR